MSTWKLATTWGSLRSGDPDDAGPRRSNHPNCITTSRNDREKNADSMRPACRGRRGFTLIELLVVIASIAILAAILFPVFASARENVRKANMRNDLKHMSLAIGMYAADYE